MPYFLLVLATLFWSGNFVISRGMHASLPPMGLSFWRWVVALLILCLFTLPQLRRDRELLFKHSRYMIIQGILGVTAFNSLIYMAMQTTTAINGVLLTSMTPILIVVLSWIRFGELLTLRQITGVFVSLTGVLLIIAKGELAALLRVDFNQGDMYVILAGFMWSLYSTNLKSMPKGLHPFSYMTGIVIVGLIGILPFYLLEISQGKTVALNAGNLATIVYVGIFASVMAFLFWNRAVRIVGANKAGPFVHLMPVFSTILAIIFLGEKFVFFHTQGMLFIFGGIFMTTFRVQKRGA